MRKFLLTSFTIVVVVAAGSYGICRHYLPAVPGALRAALGEEGITLSYGQVELAPRGLSFKMHDVGTAGGVPYVLKAKSVVVGLELAFAESPLRLKVALEEPRIDRNGAAGLRFGKARRPSFLTRLFARLVGFDVIVRDGEGLGAHGIELRLLASGLSLDGNGISRVNVSHSIEAERLDQAPLLGRIRWHGESVFADNVLQWHDQEAVLGPISLRAGGKYELSSGKWNAELAVPESTIAFPTIRGYFAADLEAEGFGLDPDGIYAQGKISAHGVELSLQLPSISGKVTGNLDVGFSRAQTLALQGQVKADFSAAEVRWGATIAKPVGMPLALDVAVDGKDGTSLPVTGHAVLDNLRGELSGSLALDGQYFADLSLDTGAGSSHYAGPLFDASEMLAAIFTIRPKTVARVERSPARGHRAL